MLNMKHATFVTTILAVLSLSGAGCAGEPAEGTEKPVSKPRVTSQPVDSELRVGRYSYLADAAIMIDCFSGESYPVAFVKDHAALERAYVSARQAPAETLTVVFEGYLQDRPALEEGLVQTQLVVDHFIRFLDSNPCEQPSLTEFRSRPWTLLAINELAVVVPADHRPPSLTFGPDSSLTGFTGCNVLNGSYQFAGSVLRIGRVATTKKFCPQVSDLETSFTRTLADVVVCERAGDSLRLITADQDTLRFLQDTEL